VGFPRRAIAQAEAGLSYNNDHNVRLVEFYQSRGIEFLGDLAFAKDVLRAGARWTAPTAPDHADLAGYQGTTNAISFQAARALLGLKQAEVAEQSGISKNTISKLELGEVWPNLVEQLRDFYVGSGIEFLGWTNANTNVIYGAGVRWSEVGLKA
jgi:hypothetical protein